MSIIPVTWRLRQKHDKFEASLSYIERPQVKKKLYIQQDYKNKREIKPGKQKLKNNYCWQTCSTRNIMIGVSSLE
jgi:hypothetical protein